MEQEEIKKRYEKLKDQDKILFHVRQIPGENIFTRWLIMIMAVWVVYIISLFFFWFFPLVSVFAIIILFLLLVLVFVLMSKRGKQNRRLMEKFLREKSK